MGEEINLFRCCLVLLLSVIFVSCALSPAPVPQFDISEYVYGVDQDLQARARAAIEVEKRIYESRSRLRDTLRKGPCPDISENPCPPSRYRTPSGACNNIRQPAWGARSSPFLKFLPPAYSDGISSPRESQNGHLLPSSKEVISRFLAEKSSVGETHEGLTSLSGIWSELILRDLAEPIHPTLEHGNCCTTHKQQRHPECYEIKDENSCKSYIRCAPTLTAHSCNFKYREQMNGASGYLDGSDLYGSTDDNLHRMRTYSRGKVDIAACELCNTTNKSPLGVVYTALLLEHNRLADMLAEVNKHWDESTLFLEARRAVVAQIQHITFNEFIPSILGETALVRPEFSKSKSGFYDGYSSTNRGGTYDAFAFAALPFLKSLIKHPESPNSKFEDHINDPAKKVGLDESFVLQLHTARDQGVPGYVEFVEQCSNGTVQVEDFTDLQEIMKPDDVKLLQSLYSDVKDIDLVIGGSLERPKAGMTVGPTFGCILERQFIKIRNSDRFWYENDMPPSSLSAAQLAEIRKVSLAGILCANVGMKKIQPKALIQPDAYLNAKIICDQHDVLDISSWREDPAPELITDNSMSSILGSELASEITDDMINTALKKAEEDLVQRKQLEYNSWLEQRTVDPKSWAGTAASFSKANKDALLLANSSIFYELVTNEILNGVHGLKRRRKRQAFDDNFSNIDFTNLLQTIDMSTIMHNKKATNHEEIGDCPRDEGPCDPTTPYRTLSGYCNNLRNPHYGQSLTTFARLLPSVYEDGVSQPRSRSVTGSPLPNPRVVSRVIHPDISNLHNRYTLMMMQFAQFVDHDLTMTPIHKGFAESIPSCRSCDSPRTVHPECSPIPIPPGDHFFPTVNVSSGARMCFPSMRSLPGQQRLGPREQVNQNTGFLDASVVYGENNCICNILRGFNGRMNITGHPNRGKDLLPQTQTLSECKTKSGFCFVGGDGRASEQPGLTVIHTLWVREHNRIMDSLRQINPHWDGEKLFQETRRIISAMLQHIVYNEFLPRILGWNAVSLYGLKLGREGYYKEYSPTCNPSILTEFASAAYRIGHSMLRPHLPRMDSEYRAIDPPILLRDGFFNTDMLYQPGMVDEMLRGLVATPMETLDQFITGEVTNHLFENHAIPHSGVDLIALNIHRARDHGIPSYNDYRALCNLKRAEKFEDLGREMAPEVIARMQSIYKSPDDIDLFSGGMSERPLQGGLVGPTFACIIGIQFRQLRKCDRFWYETDDPNIRFTKQQLDELRKTTLSKVLCENMDQHNKMQTAAFDLASDFLNPRIPCGSMPHMDLSAWKETRHGCQIGGRNVAVGESGFPTPCTSCICTSEGTQCASLRVTDCNQLLREASREAILRDDVCTAQCGFVLASTDLSSQFQQFTSPSGAGFPGFAPERNSLRSPVSFNGFKLPDLSPFLG